MFNRGIKRLRRDLDDLDCQVNCTEWSGGEGGSIKYSLVDRLESQKVTIKILKNEVDKLKAIVAEVVDYVYKDKK